ncbi:hypothetical protein Q8A73_018794 [Channa argus]|nr:hypothetical protein Q8A73_018794 [Channa argus]
MAKDHLKVGSNIMVVIGDVEAAWEAEVETRGEIGSAISVANLVTLRETVNQSMCFATTTGLWTTCKRPWCDSRARKPAYGSKPYCSSSRTVPSGNIRGGRRDLKVPTETKPHGNGRPHLTLTKPRQVKVAGQALKHSFLASSQTTVNLLGRDLLLQMGVKILCDEKDIVVASRMDKSTVALKMPSPAAVSGC